MEPIKNRENVRTWKEKNPEKVKQQKARHYVKNSDRYKANQKARYDRLTPEEKMERTRKQRERRQRLKAGEPEPEIQVVSVKVEL